MLKVAGRGIHLAVRLGGARAVRKVGQWAVAMAAMLGKRSVALTAVLSAAGMVVRRAVWMVGLWAGERAVSKAAERAGAMADWWVADLHQILRKIYLCRI